jgi:hypothetical protein
MEWWQIELKWAAIIGIALIPVTWAILNYSASEPTKETAFIRLALSRR